jgi:hypothetical protein
MGADAAFYQVHPGRQTIGIATVLHQLAIADHGAQTTSQDFAAIIRYHFERTGDVFALHGPPVLLEQRNNVIALGGRGVDFPAFGPVFPTGIKFCHFIALFGFFQVSL